MKPVTARLGRIALPLALSLLLTSCQLFQLPGASTTEPTTQSTSTQQVASLRASTVKGRVLAPAVILGDDGQPAPIIGNSSSGIIGNSSSGIIGNSSSGIIGNSSSGYRVMAASPSVPLAGALVLFTTPDEQFLKGSDGQILRTTTDSDGRYAMPDLPEGQPIVVTVMMPGNRRLVGFTTTVQGENLVDVDLATTFVTEFLRDHARRAAVPKTMDDYPQDKILAAVAETRGVLSRHDIDPPDLRVSEIPALRNAYAIVVGTLEQGLSDAWKDLLGERPLAVTAEPLGLSSGYYVSGMTEDPGPGPTLGTLYLSVVSPNGSQIMRRDPSGTLTTLLDTPIEDLNGLGWTFGTAWWGGVLYVAQAQAWDGQHGHIAGIHPGSALVAPTTFPYVGNPFTAAAGPVDDLEVGASDVAFDSTGAMYVADGDQHRILRAPAGEGQRTFSRYAGGAAGDIGFVDGQATDARFAVPANVTVHDGALYVSDTSNQRIRRIDLSTGAVTTVLGSGPTDRDGDGALASGYDGDGHAPLDSRLASPHKVVFDPEGRLIVADTLNQRVRIVQDGTVRTLAGLPLKEGGQARTGGEAASVYLGLPYYMCWDASGDLLISDQGEQGRVWRLWLRFGR